MSTNNRKRERVDGHPGIYRRGPSFQARHRDAAGKVVSRTFQTLDEAINYRAARAEGSDDATALGKADKTVVDGELARNFDTLAEALRYQMIAEWERATIEDPADIVDIVAHWIETLAEHVQDLGERIEKLEARP